MEVREARAGYNVAPTAESASASAADAVPPGYKRTEVGVIPGDWSLPRLDGLVNGLRGIRYGIVQPGKYDPKGRFMVRGQDYSKGWVGQDELFRVSATVEEPFTNARIRAGDILVTIVGASTGKVAIVPDWLDGANLTQTTARIAINEAKADNAYCGYVLSSWYGIRQVQNYIKGGAQPGLNCGDIKKFLIPSPPTKAEQEAIAEALSDADALIDSLQQLIAKKRAIKQGAMQGLLTGETRLPGFSGAWEVKRLGEIAHIKTGSRNNQDKVEDGEYPFFVRSAAVERIGSYSHDCEAILVPGEGDIGSIFHYIDGRFDVHQRVYAITQFFSDVLGKYVYLYMTVHFGAHAMQNSVKATVDSLRLPTFQEFEIRLPPSVDEQTAIAAVLSDIDAEIEALDARLDKTRALKQGMMQALLSGKIRLEKLAQRLDGASAC